MDNLMNSSLDRELSSTCSRQACLEFEQAAATHNPLAIRALRFETNRAPAELHFAAKSLREQRQINGISHGSVAGGIQMKTISSVIGL
jgi:hypothetical protein